MAIRDRGQSFSKIQRWLDGPKPQKPNADKILSQMLIDEQLDLLRFTNTRQAWSLVSYPLASIAGTSEYTINVGNLEGQANLLGAGKVYNIVRATDDPDLPYVSIPYDDFDSLDYGKLPGPDEINPALAVFERVAIYRSGLQDQLIKAVIQPCPQEVLNYTFYFYPGGMDRLYSLWTNQGIVPECVDYRDIRSTLALLPYTEWPGMDAAGNDTNRKRIAAGLQFQFEQWTPIIDEYIKQINSPRSFDIGMWDD